MFPYAMTNTAMNMIIKFKNIKYLSENFAHEYQNAFSFGAIPD